MTTDHVVVRGSDGAFVCEHCGAERPSGLPRPVMEWVADCKRFIKEHKSCKPQEVTP